MDGLLNYSMAFVLVTLAVLVLMGKADGVMAKYRLTFKERKPCFVKYRSYDAKRARPLLALVLFLAAVMLVLEYLLRPVPDSFALIVLAVMLPPALLLEFRCRKKD